MKLLWNDDEIIVVKGVRVLNAEASKRVYKELLSPGREIPDKLLQVDKLVALLEKMEAAKKTEEETVEETSEDVEEVAPVEETETSAEEETVEETVEETSKELKISEGYKSFIDFIVNSISTKVYTKSEFAELVKNNIVLVQSKIVVDELAEQLEQAELAAGITDFDKTIIAEKILYGVRFYARANSDDMFKIFEETLDSMSNDDDRLKRLFRFISANANKETLDTYKKELFMYIKAKFTDKNTAIYSKEFGVLPTPTNNVLNNIGNYSKNLYYYVLDSLTEEQLDNVGIVMPLRREFIPGDPYGGFLISIYEDEYKDFMNYVNESAEESHTEDEEPIFPRRTVDPEDEEPIFPRRRTVEPEDAFIPRETHTDLSEDESEDDYDDEEVYGVKRLGKFLEPAKKPTAIAFAVSSIATMFTAFYGVNPKTVWFQDCYGGFAKFLYTSLTGVLAVSGLLQLAMYAINKKSENVDDVLEYDGGEFEDIDENSNSEEDSEEFTDMDSSLTDDDSAEYTNGFRRFPRR